MSSAMDRHIEVVKQYPGQQQVDLAVEIEVPGSWFGVGPMGALTPTERREKYTAQAVEYSEVREFPGASRTARKTKEKAICFICCADAAHEPNSEGYCMKLSQWNCYRNNTFKDRREDELPFIPGQAPAAEGGVAVNLKAPQTPSIKTVFTLTSEGVHSQRDGNRVQSGGPACRRAASWTAALSKRCRKACKSTGQLFRHLRTCNHDLWFQLQLSSKPSCTITTSTTGLARHSRKLSILTRNSTVKSRVSRTLSRTGLLKRRRWRRMERRIKREDTRRTITVLFVTLNKKTHTVSALELHCALSTEHSECTQHSVHNQS